MISPEKAKYEMRGVKLKNNQNRKNNSFHENIWIFKILIFFGGGAIINLPWNKHFIFIDFLKN